MSNKILNLDLSKDPIMPAIVYGRVGDDRLQTVTVNLTRRDEIADLTGYTITFEGTTYKGQTKVFDSDNVSTTTAGLKKGTFEYTFPNMAFAVAGKYEQAYFSIVKDGKRDSTAGFEIYVDGNADIDAPEAETIITEYTKLVAELNRLQKQAIDEMDGNFATAQEKISDLETEINTLRNKIDQALTDFEKGNFWTKDESFSKEQTETLIDQKSENQWTQKTDKTLGAEADMNDYKDLGTYAIGIGHRKNQPGNLGSQQGWLSVYRLSPESTVVSQTALYPDVGEYSGFTRMFTRSLINYNTNLWSPWREITRPFATTEQVLAGGVDDSVFMTPKRTAEQILARFGQSFTPSTKFIAHRGNNSFYPENSIAAFEKTSRHWGAETDIQLTTDGKWYCFHDRTLDRMTNGTGNFMDKTSIEIDALRLDTGNGISTLSDTEKKIPTFDQYLNACLKARIVPVIEITPLKTDFTDAQLDSIVTVIRRKGLLNKCVIICFTYEVLVKMRQRMPYTVMHWLISEYSEEMIQKCVINNFVPSFDYSKASVNQALIDKIHDAGLECGLWTVPYSDHQKYTDMGVDNITTDSASGNLRYFEPALRSGMLPNNANLTGPTYIEETSNGEIHIRVNVTGGQNDVGVYICALESWAIPRHSLTLIGYVRSTKVTGFAFVPVSVGVGGYSANDSSIADANIKFGYLTTGTNWEQRATYAAFDLFYRI